MDALAQQIIHDPNAVPTVFRRALTLGVPQKDSKGGIIRDFSHYFFAFCNSVYSVSPSQILKKGKTEAELEAAALRSANCNAHRYGFAPFFGSPIDFLIGLDDSALPQPTDHTHTKTNSGGRDDNHVLEAVVGFEPPEPEQRVHRVNESRYTRITGDTKVWF